MLDPNALRCFHGHLPVLMAYIGMGPGPDVLPYFFALLGVVGTAVLAVLQWPFLAILNWLKGKRGPKEAPNAPQAVAAAPPDGSPAGGATDDQVGRLHDNA
ncbi:MAG TPA: hypothetical protein VMS17_05540 [Gemmataceae bacterium]|nr:hypothetical protein [Gemmataceae bacterium]